MPVRSLTSSVMRWPDPNEIEAAVRTWSAKEAPRHPGLVRLGIFGSYARGAAGVGSDLDLVAVVRESKAPFAARPMDWHVLSLPVAADLLVYTEHEWQAHIKEGGRFARMLSSEVVWIYEQAPTDHDGAAQS